MPVKNQITNIQIYSNICNILNIIICKQLKYYLINNSIDEFGLSLLFIIGK